LEQAGRIVRIEEALMQLAANHDGPTIASVQVGRIQPLGVEGVPSGFVKSAVVDPVEVTPLGLAGDEQADVSVHGGPDKAVYLYPSEHYPQWLRDVPRHERLLVAGGFGENITTTGLHEDGVCIGDVLRMGTAEVQVTQPRQPCFKLGLRFDDNGLGRLMVHSGRTGWYVRVLTPGRVQAGALIQTLRRPNPDWSVARFNRLITARREAPSEILAQVAALDGLAEVWKQGLLMALDQRHSS
jgi:MOSC domain-containing protein YiiM